MEVLIIDSRAPSLTRLGGCAKGWRVFFQGEERITHDVLNYFDEALCSPRRYQGFVEPALDTRQMFGNLLTFVTSEIILATRSRVFQKFSVYSLKYIEYVACTFIILHNVPVQRRALKLKRGKLQVAQSWKDELG